MADIVEQRQAAYYLPPELWLLIFSHHTHPHFLWTTGRQVCSTWRSEIPKIFAREYLEDPIRVQIYFDCGRTFRIDGVKRRMAVNMVFDRYEDQSKTRCVFTAETPTTGTRNERYERTKLEVWRSKLEVYLGATSGARAEGGRFDLPPYQVWIRTSANDTEFPGLECDFHKREISFEWEGMFACFYREAAELERRDLVIMDGAREGLSRGNWLLMRMSADARRGSAKRIRRERVKRWYMENYGRDFRDSSFEEKEEETALKALPYRVMAARQQSPRRTVR